jgi:hypothetical protein
MKRIAVVLLVVAVGVLPSEYDRARRAGAPREVASAPAGQTVAATPNPSTDSVFICPMDRDIRSYKPGFCPRCKMKLVNDVPEPAEYHMDLSVSPEPMPGQRVRLTLEIFDPWKGNPVKNFAVVHEKLFHAFIVSRDLSFFVHDHPVWDDAKTAFTYDVTFPRAGMYRILGDFYPEAATPQLIAQTVFVPGDEYPKEPPARDYSPKQGDNLNVALSTAPEMPVAGGPTQLRFTLNPADGLERYLGAWGHMLAASDDLIDMMHTHPFATEAGPVMQFNLVFPRARVYRVWVQFQRKGVVNTAHFDIPVRPADTSQTLPRGE